MAPFSRIQFPAQKELRTRARTRLRGSYSHHYRRGLPKLLTQGNVVREAVMYDAPPVPGAPHPGSLMVGQQFTEAALREKLASLGTRVELGGEL
ncbi:hypothetical protein ACIBIZ_48100 [Nonomuraea spiralis]|uniref:hypothetical protein n=1 Tax=Nonomuraea spiralis TaxID=46182 RepID=UPI0037BC54A8